MTKGEDSRPSEVLDFSGDRFEDVNFRVHEGEVVGLAGVVGAGRTEILETIIGFRRSKSGQHSFA